jgi:hypothetical protein
VPVAHVVVRPAARAFPSSLRRGAEQSSCQGRHVTRARSRRATRLRPAFHLDASLDVAASCGSQPEVPLPRALPDRADRPRNQAFHASNREPALTLEERRTRSRGLRLRGRRARGSSREEHEGRERVACGPTSQRACHADRASTTRSLRSASVRATHVLGRLTRAVADVRLRSRHPRRRRAVSCAPWRSSSRRGSCPSARARCFERRDQHGALRERETIVSSSRTAVRGLGAEPPSRGACPADN